MQEVATFMKVVVTTGREKILAGRYLSQWLPDGKKPTLFCSLGLGIIGRSLINAFLLEAGGEGGRY